MAAFVPRLKFVIFSDTESFTLLWELSHLSSTAAVLVPCFLSHFYYCRVSWCCSTGTKYLHVYIKMLLILLVEYCSRLAFLSFLQIHSINLKITTGLSSSSAFLFDSCGSRMKQIISQMQSINSLQIDTSFIMRSLWKNALGMLLIFNKQ